MAARSATPAGEHAPPDAIFGLIEAFRSDPPLDKVNLVAGVYRRVGTKSRYHPNRHEEFKSRYHPNRQRLNSNSTPIWVELGSTGNGGVIPCPRKKVLQYFGLTPRLYSSALQGRDRI